MIHDEAQAGVLSTQVRPRTDRIEALARVLAVLGVGLLAFATLAGCTVTIPADERARLKDEIRQEVLRELEARPPAPSQQDIDEALARMRQDMERELAAARQAQVAVPVPAGPSGTVVAGPTGSAEGRIVSNGLGLPGCRIKLVHVTSTSQIGGPFGVFREGPEFETTTDEKGEYRLDGLPVGDYRLKWELPGDTGWIRRLTDRPDVTVAAGEVSSVRTVETNKPLVPR